MVNGAVIRRREREGGRREEIGVDATSVLVRYEV
jgi:hypothetical protein